MSCPSWSEPSHRGSIFRHGEATVAASRTPCFSRAARHWASLSSHVGGVGRGVARVENGRVVGEADRRPDHPAVRLDLVGDERIAVIRARLESAELVLWIVDERRKQELALVGGDQRPVVGDELRAESAGEQRQKDAQRPDPATVAAEIVEPPAVHRRELEPGATPHPALRATFSRTREKRFAPSPACG